MDLQQIHAAYNQQEDRVLLRLSLRDTEGELQEIRAWITRHLLKALWPGIINAMEMQITLDQPHAAHASAEIVEIQREASLMDLQARGGFNQTFKTDISKFPLGEKPILLAQAHIKVDPGQYLRIQFVGEAQRNFGLTLTPSTLHAFCKLLQDAMVNVDWGFKLSLPQVKTPQTAGQGLLN